MIIEINYMVENMTTRSISQSIVVEIPLNISIFLGD